MFEHCLVMRLVEKRICKIIEAIVWISKDIIWWWRRWNNNWWKCTRTTRKFDTTTNFIVFECVFLVSLSIFLWSLHWRECTKRIQFHSIFSLSLSPYVFCSSMKNTKTSNKNIHFSRSWLLSLVCTCSIFSNAKKKVVLVAINSHSSHSKHDKNVWNDNGASNRMGFI